MKYKQEVHVPVDFFYQVVQDSARHELLACGEQATQGQSLQGISYKKQAGTGQEYEVTIIEDRLNEAYGFVSKTSTRTYTSNYHLSSVNDERCMVNYTESVEAQGSLLAINDAIMGRMLRKSKRKRMKRLFSSIEEEYQKSGAKGV